MNELHKEIERLAPGYELDSLQKPQVDNHKDPKGYALILEKRLEDIKDDVIRYLDKEAPDLNITRDDITNHDAMVGIRVFKHGGLSGQDKQQLDNLGTLNLMRIVKSKYDFWGNLYWKYLGREPDKEGLEWWENRIEQLFKDSIK